MNKKKYIFFRRSDPCIFEAAQYGLHLFKIHKPLCAATLLQGFCFFKYTIAPKDTKNFFLLEKNTLRNLCLKIKTDEKLHNSVIKFISTSNV